MSHTSVPTTTARPTLWQRMKMAVGWRPHARSHEIPVYLESSDDEKRFLQLYHNRLSTVPHKGLVARTIWLTGPDGAEYQIPDGETVADDLEALHQQLQLLDTTKCRSTIFALNCDVGPAHEGLNLLLHRYGTFWKGSLPPLTLKTLVLEMLRHQWKGSDKRIETALKQMQSPVSFQWNLPSRSGATTNKGLDHDIQWLRHDPATERFLSLRDWPIYISEPFAKRPIMAKVRIIDVAPDGSSHQRLVMLVSSRKVIPSIDQLYSSAIAGSSPEEVLSCHLEILLFVMLGAVISDTMSYVEATTKQLDKMELLCRHHPSVSKVQYLLHTQECYSLSARACRENAAFAQDIANQIELPATQKLYSIRAEIQDLRQDLDYLARTLDDGVAHIDFIRRRTIDQMDLFDKRRNRIIGILIAIYVPLAFATSFFGMNIADDLTTLGYWSNSTVRVDNANEPIPFNSRASDPFLQDWQALIDSLGYSGPPNIVENGTDFNLSIPNWFLDERNISEDLQTTVTWNKSSDSGTNYTALFAETWPIWFMNNDPNATASSTSVTYTQTNQPPGNRVWQLRTFWITALSLSLGSIIVPIIAGHAIRFIARLSYSHRTAFRTTTSLLWLVLWGVFCGRWLHGTLFEQLSAIIAHTLGLLGVFLTTVAWSHQFGLWSWLFRILFCISTLSILIVLPFVDRVEFFAVCVALGGFAWIFMLGQWILARQSFGEALDKWQTTLSRLWPRG